MTAITGHTDGVLVVIKPKGPTSTACLSGIKKKLGIKKAGHAGTLDPMATGVLLLLLGQATKLSAYLMNNKIYSGTLELGRVTDTWDDEGTTLSKTSIDNITLLQINQAVQEWLDLTSQEVPAYSAAKHEGQRLYDLSRKGLPCPVKTKDIKIFRAELLEVELPYVKFRVECSSGTYIRSLAHSLGIRLGTGATLTELTREYSHPFSLDQAITAEEACLYPDRAWAKVVPIVECLPDWPRVILDQDQEKDIRNGKQLPAEIAKTTEDKVLLLDFAQQPLALAERVFVQNSPMLKVLRGLWQ